MLEYDGTYGLDLESPFWGQLMLLVGVVVTRPDSTEGFIALLNEGSRSPS